MKGQPNQLNHINTLPKVAIISDERFPSHHTNTQQVIKNADALTAAGLDVELLIPIQWHGLFEPGYDVAKATYQYYNVPERLKIRKLWNFPAGRFRFEKFTHVIASLVFTAFKKYDVLYTRNEFTAIAAVMLGRKTVFETYRKFGDEYPRLMQWLAKRAGRPNFLGMVLHSQLSYDSMLRAGFPSEKLAVFHNGFDFSDMEPMLTKTAARQILGWETDRRYVVYTGNMQANKGIESIVEMAAMLPTATFVLVGGRPEDLERLQNVASAMGVKNLQFTGHRPIKEVSRYLYAADCLLIPPASVALEHGRTVLPFKTFLYLAAGRPILAPRQPDMTEILVHEENALLVEPDNLPQAVAMLQRLFDDAAFHLSICENAAASAQKLTWENRAIKIIAWLSKIYNKPNLPIEDKAPSEETSAQRASNAVF